MLINQNRKINMGAYFSILAIIIILIVIFFIMYKYQVEGEAIPPFKISKMIVVSAVKTENLQLINDIYNADIIQNNDIKISIEKNEKYKKDAIIRKVTINNIQIDKKNTVGNIEIYRPSTNAKMYDYKEEYKVQENIEYFGAQVTNLKGEKLEISNQGGIIEFSVVLNNLNKLQYNENETIKIDGTLLRQIGEDRLKYKVEFDLIIELESDIKLKTKISLDLPAGNIIQNGIETIEEDNIKTIFKRI